MDESYIRKLAELEADRLTRSALLRRVAGGAFTIGSGAALLAACGGSSSASSSTSPSTGKVGGTLSFLGIEGEEGAQIAKPFLAKHAVTLHAAFVPDQATMLTKLKTGGTRSADVLSLNKDWALREIQLGYVRPLDLDRLPNFAGVFTGLKSAPWIVHDNQTWGVPVIWGDGPCVYDPTAVSGPPPKYTDFADSKWAHSLTTIDDPLANQWLVAKSLGFGQNGQHNLLTQSELDKVKDVWVEIKKNVVSFASSFGDITDLLVRGDAKLAMGNWAAVVAFAKAKGKTLAFGNPSVDGTYYWGDNYYITSEGENVATAYAFVDYMSSAKSNAKLSATLQSGCTIAAAKDMLPAGSISTKYPYDQVQTTLNGDFVQSTTPPVVNQGDIVGGDAWVTSWEQIKSS